MTMIAVAWSMLIGALAQVEGLAPDDSGLLSFGTPPGSGGIFVERGRVCWVAAHGLQRRLRDLLRTRANIKDAELDRVYERCRAEGRVLGQTLVEEGWIEPRELEIVLRRHSAESLVELCRGGADPMTTWSSRGGIGYTPQFTFRPTDVLLDVAAVVAPQAQHAARLELAMLDGPGRRGAAFFVDAVLDTAIPVAEVGEGMTVQVLRTLGRWARSVAVATRELGASPSFTLVATATGDTISIWWRDALLYAVLCDDRSSVAAVTAHHLASA
jgi:hypothetical protein